jgi:2-keto-4-pentenoate hydratase/2-oxohepta-3-ene-1,7-dioic acid hydratase in catechol pathway
MKLATFNAPGAPASVGGEIRDGSAIAFGDGSSVLERLRTGDRDPASGESWPLEQVTLLAPIANPGAIIGVGLNYAAHAAETGATPPEVPLLFAKLPSSSSPPGATVKCPPTVRRLDYEGELAVILGNDGKPAGYAVADDVSARDLQRREPQWLRAKGADGFCPWGPWITTADEIEDPHELRLRTWVNGELRQDSSTSDMIFKIPALIEFLAEVHAPQAGDLILTGTPSGVGQGLDPRQFLEAGDLVRIEIERLGTIEHSIG